eukprot:13523342-Heterocapsa_arctica.AAC.1
MLQGILKPVWSSSLSFKIDLRSWELSLKRYEEAADVLIPDNIKCAVTRLVLSRRSCAWFPTTS